MVRMIAALTAWLMLMPSLPRADENVTPSQFIGSRTLVSFWSGACAPCVRQLPILISLARLEPGLHVALVSVKDEGAEAVPYAMPSNMRHYTVENGGMSLHNFSATERMLPFSSLLRANGSLCRSHAGIQSLGALDAWAKQC